MKIIEDNNYLDLSTYPEIYQELVFVRNECIRWLDEHALLNRNRCVITPKRLIMPPLNEDYDYDELTRHRIALPYRMGFKANVEHLLYRLYSHDATEALYDFQNIDLGNWSDTEANRLEKELNQLQAIIFKLEVKYQLQYKMRLSYSSAECKLYLNSIEIESYQSNSIKSRLLSALYSKPDVNWDNEDIEKFFIKNFSYSVGDLKDSSIFKAAKDIVKDVAIDAHINDFLTVSNASVRVNPKYLP